ncbi:MAG: hypothetical protein ACFCVD_20075 [Nodosilinea sp.]
MLNYLHWFSDRVVKVTVVGLMALVLVCVGVLGNPSPSLAGSKATLGEGLDLEISKAAQEFAASIMDNYADALEDSFGAALKPIKSVTKDLTKQLSKAAASPDAASPTLAPQLAASQEALATAATSLEALVADTDSFKATLAEVPAQIKAVLEAQFGAKFDDLEGAFTQVSEAMSQLVQDTASLDTSDPTAAAATLTEHSALLTQTIEAAKTVIDGFGD